jgi:4-amino-4-deoxy-L-arabinose transferase-like glycosyltransferase
MDDVDAVQAQIARNMLESGDWVTARLNGVKYLEKAPLKYWLIACSFAVFGVHDWAARIPVALSAVLLCWLVYCIGAWAFSQRAGKWAGVALATCVGLFLFTRVLFPDVMLTLAVTFTLWALLRALEDEEPRPRLWAWLAAAGMAIGVLLKGLIGVVFPAAIGLLYLALRGRLLDRRAWRRLHPFSGALIFLAMAAPWHVLAILRNPPYFDFTLSAQPFQYRGFFWFYFINEHVLRFLDLRHPRDYNTVPRPAFWLLHLVWLFPWSVYLPAAARLSFRPVDRAGRTRLLCLCWVGFILVFFTFSTTQEYYSMPAYPALALLIGAAVAEGGRWITTATRAAGLIAGIAAAACLTILYLVRNVPAPGDISAALKQNPELYTLSLGHMADLTLRSFAYLRLPLAVAALAFVAGAVGAWKLRGEHGGLALAAMMVLFAHAARLAMVVFDPYMSSRPLAEALRRAPPGEFIAGDQYYAFSSIFFYANRRGWLWDGRVTNLEYGSLAPDAPDVFLDDARFAQLWYSPKRCYVAVAQSWLPRLEKIAGTDRMHLVAAAGGKYLYSNHAPHD